MKHHEIGIKELQAWLVKERVLFASSSKEHKRLYCTLYGGFQIEHGGKIVWEGVQPFDAVEKYNDITHPPV